MISVFKRMFGMRKSLGNQVLFLAIAPMIVVFCITSYISIATVMSSSGERIKSYEEALLSERKEKIKNYTGLAVKAIASLPRKQAREYIKRLTYGKDGYFWINDLNLVMVSHPDPKLEGKDVSGLRDPNGVYIIREAVKLCREAGEGYFPYHWKAPGDEKMQPKISYVKLIKKWNWIVGTGIYTRDIDELVMKEKEKVHAETLAFILKIFLVSAASILAIAAIMRHFINKLVNRPLADVAGAVKNFSNDLTTRIPVAADNEIGELADCFNSYRENMHNIVGKVTDAVMVINSYAGEIASAVEQQAATASQQSAAVSEITSTMEELSASSMQIADHSNSVVDIAAKTWEDTKKGATAVESVIMKMGEINADNQNSIMEIVELGRKSKEITKVMEIINTIADQTKLIAFNAALEASSAGEAGKRFGVVAVEIRRLADSVMESTGDIEGKINEIQEAISRLVIASEKGSKGIQDGMEHSNQTAVLLSDIVDAAQTTTSAAKQISLSTQQQKTASNQVVGALKEIVSGSSQTSDSIGQISSVSRDLARLSDNLRELVEKFRLKDEQKKTE